MNKDHQQKELSKTKTAFDEIREKFNN